MKIVASISVTYNYDRMGNAIKIALLIKYLEPFQKYATDW